MKQALATALATLLTLIFLSTGSVAYVVRTAPEKPTKDECTAEYVAENGICLTWDDIRNQPTHTQGETA